MEYLQAFCLVLGIFSVLQISIISQVFIEHGMASFEPAENQDESGVASEKIAVGLSTSASNVITVDERAAAAPNLIEKEKSGKIQKVNSSTIEEPSSECGIKMSNKMFFKQNDFKEEISNFSENPNKAATAEGRKIYALILVLFTAFSLICATKLYKLYKLYRPKDYEGINFYELLDVRYEDTVINTNIEAYRRREWYKKMLEAFGNLEELLKGREIVKITLIGNKLYLYLEDK